LVLLQHQPIALRSEVSGVTLIAGIVIRSFASMWFSFDPTLSQYPGAAVWIIDLPQTRAWGGVHGHDIFASAV
jgi:hypothetical protein